ncbi:hypothetical protein ACFLY2_02685 [Patescibacteria group bacterium]
MEKFLANRSSHIAKEEILKYQEKRSKLEITIKNKLKEKLEQKKN